MSQFDPNAFLHAEITEQSKKRPPLPVGDYVGVLGEGKIVQWTSRDQSKSGFKYEAPVTVQVPAEVQSFLGLTTPTLTLTVGVMLDYTPQGTLDMAPGRNGGLRRFREALDMNREGEVFSFPKTWGKTVLVKIKHEEYQGEPVERVDGLARP